MEILTPVSCNPYNIWYLALLHELHESKFPLVSHIEFIRSKLSNYYAHVPGVHVTRSHCHQPARRAVSGTQSSPARGLPRLGAVPVA